MIKDTELKTKDKETEKKGLEADTASVKEDIKKQNKIVEEKKEEY